MNIDENGDAEGNYTLLALLDKPSNRSNHKREKSMQPVGQFTHETNKELPVINRLTFLTEKHKF